MDYKWEECGPWKFVEICNPEKADWRLKAGKIYEGNYFHSNLTRTFQTKLESQWQVSDEAGIGIGKSNISASRTLTREQKWEHSVGYTSGAFCGDLYGGARNETN